MIEWVICTTRAKVQVALEYATGVLSKLDIDL